MPGVILKPNEPLESGVRRYKRTCEKSRILAEMRKREYFEKPSAKRMRLLAAAKKRSHKQSKCDGHPASLAKKKKRKH